MDPGETIADTIIRETLEECGLLVRVGSRTGAAVQFAWSESEQTYFEKRCTFVNAIVLGPDESKLQPDHEVLWVDAETARAMLTHEAHAWVIKS
jgi:8-oxo-dGTP pyrophosphatase MutT (NUDIX family)